jgi:hypothetical protein
MVIVFDVLVSAIVPDALEPLTPLILNIRAGLGDGLGEADGDGVGEGDGEGLGAPADGELPQAATMRAVAANIPAIARLTYQSSSAHRSRALPVQVT